MNKHLLKIALIQCLLFIGSIRCIQAQQLVIWLKSGEKIVYNLEENPKTSFSSTDVIISTNTITVNYPSEQVLKYTYDMSSTSVDKIEKNELVVSKNGNTIIFENLQQGGSIQIYSLDGTLLSSTKITDGKSTTVSLESYPSGIYLIKVNDSTYKILKQ